MSLKRRAALLAVLAAAIMAAAAEQARAAAGVLDTGFGVAASREVARLGPGASPFALAARPDGGLVLAGRLRDTAGEFTLLAPFSSAGTLEPGMQRLRFGAATHPPQRAAAVLDAGAGATVFAGLAGRSWYAARLLADGSPDPSFGAAGAALTESSGGYDTADGPTSAALTPDGRVVVAGATPVQGNGQQIAVARYTSRGAPDRSFGADGFALLQLGARNAEGPPRSSATGLVVQADGRIVIAGRATDGAGEDRPFIARLTTAGGLDRSFARSGRWIGQVGRASLARAASSGFNGLAAAPGGDLLAVGDATGVAGDTAVLAGRFTAAGRPVKSFGDGGVLITQLAGSARLPVSLARTVGVASDGSALLAGSERSGALGARLTPAGRLDCGYGTAGRTIFAAAGTSSGFDARHQGVFAAIAAADGALIVAGTQATGPLLARLQGGPGRAVHSTSRPTVRLLAVRSGRRGSGYAYALVDGRCRTRRVRVTIADARRRLRSVLVRVPAGTGPRTVCVRLRRVRAGRLYRVRATAAASRVLRAERTTRRHSRQDGCV